MRRSSVGCLAQPWMVLHLCHFPSLHPQVTPINYSVCRLQIYIDKTRQASLKGKAAGACRELFWPPVEASQCPAFGQAPCICMYGHATGGTSAFMGRTPDAHPHQGCCWWIQGAAGRVLFGFLKHLHIESSRLCGSCQEQQHSTAGEAAAVSVGLPKSAAQQTQWAGWGAGLGG